MAIGKVEQKNPINNRNDINIKTAVVVDKDTPISKMINYIDGSDWTVWYYNSVKRTTDIVETLDIKKHIVENQYTLIKDLNLKVQSPLETNKLSDISGDAIVPVNIIPQVGDIFTARIISGEIGLFVVTEVDEKSYKLDRTFSISYKLDTTNIINSDKYEALKQRVGKTFVYEKEVALDNNNPLLLEDDDAIYRNLKGGYSRLCTMYYNRFKSINGFLTVDTEAGTILDPYITYLFQSICDIDTGDIFEVVDISGDPISFIYNIIRNDGELMLSKGYLTRNTGIRGGTGSARLRKYLPLDIDWMVTLDQGNKELVLNSNSKGLPNREYNDNSYLINGNSDIEIMFKDTVQNKSIDLQKLQLLSTECPTWGISEQYWYIPILLFIIQNTLTNMKSHY